MWKKDASDNCRKGNSMKQSAPTNPRKQRK